MRIFGNELRKSFIEPAGNPVRVEPMENEVDNFVAERVVAKFVCRIALNEEAAGRVNTPGPLFQMPEHLKLLPFFGTLENVNVRFDVSGELLAFQFLGNHAVMELGFDGNRCGDVAVNEVVDEMLGLSVLPLLRMNGERFFTEWVRIPLA